MDINNLPQTLFTRVDNIHGQILSILIINKSLTILPIVTTFNGFNFSSITLIKLNRLVMKLSKPDLEMLQSEVLELHTNNNHYWQVNNDPNRTITESISELGLSVLDCFLMLIGTIKIAGA